MSLVRYCCECGHVGDVEPPALKCCPDGPGSMVPEEVAIQARAGFMRSLVLSDINRTNVISNNAMQTLIGQIDPQYRPTLVLRHLGDSKRDILFTGDDIGQAFESARRTLAIFHGLQQGAPGAGSRLN